MTNKEALKIASWLANDELCEERTEYCEKSCIECQREVQERLRQMAQEMEDNAPTIEYTFDEAFKKTVCEQELYCPKRSTGRWEEPFEMNGKSYHKCTNCHISSELILIDKHCPNCGAKMYGGRQ